MAQMKLPLRVEKHHLSGKWEVVDANDFYWALFVSQKNAQDLCEAVNAFQQRTELIAGAKPLGNFETVVLMKTFERSLKDEPTLAGRKKDHKCSLVKTYSEADVKNGISAGLSVGMSPRYNIDNKEREIERIFKSRFPENKTTTK